MNKIPELFGSKVFNDPVMKKYLPEDVYLSLKSTASRGEKLDPKIADAVAEGGHGFFL